MSTRGTSILSPFTSLRRACRDIWNKRAESLSTVDALAVVVLHGNSSIHEPDIKAHGVPLSPSPERRYPSILRKLFDARPSSKRDKTATGIDAETEIGAYRCMLLFEARYQTRMDIPRRIRRKLEPLLAEEIEYQRKLAKMDDSDWTSRIAVPPNQPSESPIRIPISVPNTGPETVSIRNVRSAVATLSPSSPPTLPLPSAAAVASAPEQVESLQSPSTPLAKQGEKPSKTLKPYTYARPNMKRVKMIALFLSTAVQTDEPWKREHIIYPNREPYELPPGVRGSKRPITSSKRVWELSRKTRRFALQKLGFLINAFLFVPSLPAIPEADE